MRRPSASDRDDASAVRERVEQHGQVVARLGPDRRRRLVVRCDLVRAVAVQARGGQEVRAGRASPGSGEERDLRHAVALLALGDRHAGRRWLARPDVERVSGGGPAKDEMLDRWGPPRRCRAIVASARDGARTRNPQGARPRSPRGPVERRRRIRTLEAGFSPPNALAGRRLQPLGHFPGTCQRISDASGRIWNAPRSVSRIPCPCPGGVPERPNGAGSKIVRGASVSRVRIPPPPLNQAGVAQAAPAHRQLQRLLDRRISPLKSTGVRESAFVSRGAGEQLAKPRGARALQEAACTAPLPDPPRRQGHARAFPLRLESGWIVYRSRDGH